MDIDILTIFPEAFAGTLSTSMLRIAQERDLLRVRTHDLRDWTEDRHRQVDDAPYGGGPGMVMKPEPFYRAVQDLTGPAPATVVLMTPQGRRLDQALAEDLAGRERLLILCGRYEGFDERIRSLADIEVSIGDYVLSGGEVTALVLTDAVTRLIPGVLGDDDSTAQESFSWGMLEYPQYTRPPEWEGRCVPEVLLSGDHARIEQWRRKAALEKTARLRPDLLDDADLTDDERAFVEDLLDGIDAESEGPVTG